ncbi:MAG: hypothetical protein JSV03_02480 [Planctomycetota bacterium]|nr:MAG: hypothetical protein JSV03_02480 [Planctomycetota bacterium]
MFVAEEKLFYPAWLMGFILALVCVRTTYASDPVDWMRAVCYDRNNPSSWLGGNNVRDALAAESYTILNANQLKQWMDARIADRRLSVAVFAKDAAPDTVADSESASCTLRQYLNTGGKIVWYGDIHMFYQGHSDGTRWLFLSEENHQ